MPIPRHNFRRLVAICCGLLPVLAAPVSGQPVVFDPQVHSLHQRGALDWDRMFTQDPEWSSLAGKFQVYLAPAGMFQDAADSDDRLRAIWADVRARGLGIEFAINPIDVPAGDRCGGRESYQPAVTHAHIVARMKRLGITPDRLSLDGPLVTGHYTPPVAGCALSIPDLAKSVARNVRPYLDAFPHLELGDIEGVPALMTFPGWQADLVAFKQGLEAELGHKLSFLRTDTNWRALGTSDALPRLATVVHSLGMRFSVIYDAEGSETTDAGWVARARQNFEYLESAGGFIPDEASIESWNENPTRVLPDTVPTTSGFLVARYKLPRTRFDAERVPHGGVAGQLAGLLHDAGGKPVANARFTVTALGLGPDQVPAAQTVSGTVPAEARKAILALRINSECLCEGGNDLVFGTFSYAETTGGSVRHTYSHVAEAERSVKSPNGPAMQLQAAQGGESLVRIAVGPAQRFGFNAPAFAVTPGAHFTLSLPIGSRTDQGLFGSAGIIWLDEHEHGISRTNLNVDATRHPIGETTTDGAGRFVVQLPQAAIGRTLRLYYEGSDALRGAYADIKPPG